MLANKRRRKATNDGSIMYRTSYRLCVHAMYYQIARDKCALYDQLGKEIDELNQKGCAAEDFSELSQLMQSCYERREQAAVISITFAAMSLEAFFYDYAAERLGDDFVDKHLDKLDTKSKFMVLPKLICGTSPDKSGKAYKSIHDLVKLRNELVHFKSKSFHFNELYKATDLLDSFSTRLKSGVAASVACVMLVMAELDRIHNSWSFYQERMKWI